MPKDAVTTTNVIPFPPLPPRVTKCPPAYAICTDESDCEGVLYMDEQEVQSLIVSLMQ